MSNSTRNAMTAMGFMALLAVGYVGFTFWRQSADIDSRNAAAEERAAEFVDQLAARDIDDEEEPVDLGFDDGSEFLINRIPGDDYGRLVRRTALGDREHVGNIRCERFHAADDNGLCLWRSGINSFKATLYDFSEGTEEEVLTWGIRLPSRARVSRDGSFASYTVFAEGSGYQDVSGFVTIAELFDTSNPEERFNLFQFDHSEEDAEYFDDINSNFWGVTWGRAGEFYATWGNGEETRVIKGNFDDKTIEILDLVGSCPSLSGDGNTLVYKKLVDEEFFLVSYDLESGEETFLNETRPVDDQVEWLDDNTIGYAIHPEGFVSDETTVQPEFDTWSLTLDGSEPELFLPNSDSPVNYQETSF